MSIQGWATVGPKKPLELFEFDPGPLGPDDVEVAVEYCGLCHSDLSTANNDWGMTTYPTILGHEAVGRVVAVGSDAKGPKVGDRVGVGWTASSCMHCRECLGGDQNLCSNAIPTIYKHQGGFANRVRAHWAWTIPLPEKLDVTSAGPLLCGGVTVFAPLATYGIQGPHRVGVVGIGGLGHMALKFASAWGCEVTAFTSSDSKADEARSFGAHNVVNSRNVDSMKSITGKLDLLLVTVNATLDWPALLTTLRPKGRMHVVGAVPEPMGIPAFSLIFGQKSVSGSPTGSPTMIADMLEFCARHQIGPQVEHFKMSDVNAAMERLESGKARYRIVLDADFSKS
ncbi:MAG: NAD(P)-dependent alcohol dehydrogenase [Planctomycetia bacterium]|nr:NAD(P)-dependent alcohol dehydrogenase [Planctomycetia bacterium]